MDGTKRKSLYLKIAESLDIGEYGTNVALTTFEQEPILEIKFSDHTKYSSFAKSVNALRLFENSKGTNTLGGIQLAYEEMFNETNGMRIGVPNTMIFTTDGKCNVGRIRCNIKSFEFWNDMYRNKASPPIKLIGIGIEWMQIKQK